MATWTERKGDSGSGIVEVILIVPVFMLLLLVAVQAALWLHGEQVVQLAASSGDQAGRVLGSNPTLGIAQAEHVAQSPGSDVEAPTVEADVLPGDALVIRVTARVPSVVPGWNPQVSASANGTIQEFRSSE